MSYNTVFLAPGLGPGGTIRSKTMCFWCLGGGMKAHFDAIYKNHVNYDRFGPSASVLGSIQEASQPLPPTSHFHHGTSAQEENCR